MWRHKTKPIKKDVFLAAIFMTATLSVSLLLLSIQNTNLWIIMSLSYTVILMIGLWFTMRISSKSIISVFTIYIFGFTFFLGGRFLAYPLMGNYNSLFTFDFGIWYSLDNDQQISLFTVICLSLITTFCGYYLSILKKSHRKFSNNSHYELNKNFSHLFYWITLALAFFDLITTIGQIRQVQSYGYMSLYRDASIDSARTFLLVRTILDIAVCFLISSASHNEPGLKRLYHIILVIYVTSGLIGILTGGRGGFITMLFFVLWLNRNALQFNLKNILLFIFGIVGLVLLTNFLTVSTRFTSNQGGLIDTIGSTLRTQGISLMVFDLSTKVDPLDYPIHAKMKVLIPGWQIIAPIIDSSVKPYELSLDSFLIHKMSPETYYAGFGYGWSVLSDFYIFSFGYYSLFLIFNLLWGYFMGSIERRSNSSTLYKGLNALLALNVFVLPRGSFSVITASVALYLVFFLLMHKKYVCHENTSYY